MVQYASQACCAVQLERECGLRREQIVCYTFGAPRIGNHAYRQYAAERVPDIWHVINDHDIVAKGLKFGYLYKRCGHRVVVRGSGRLAVRPSFFEFLLLQVRQTQLSDFLLTRGRCGC